MSSIIKGITREESDKVDPPKNNFVAKHAKTFNKSHVMRDRKKDMKAGKQKHKNDFFESITVPDPSIDGSYNDVYSGEDKIGHIILSPANQEYSWLELELPNPLAIVDVQIRRQYQGEGYFSELLNWLEDYAVKKGFKTLFLRVDDDSMIDQYELENMYDHLGFSVYNDEYMNDEMDGLYMYKPLSSAKRESAIMRGIQNEEKSKQPCPRTKARVCECASVKKLTESKEATTAVCVLEHSDTVEGTILFKQEANGPTLIAGKITGLAPGKHGFHIHEYGDLSKGCESAGAHYDPDGVDHGDLEEGHVGDLGNITADKDGVAIIKLVANRIDLTGERSVVGRSVVVHEDEDDLGKGGNAESLKTGNSGDRLACGVITLKETVNEAWSKKYKDSINCSNPKGFSQKAHCAGKKKAKKKQVQQETKGTPYPGTYEQEYDPFKTKGQRRTTGMTY